MKILKHVDQNISFVKILLNSKREVVVYILVIMNIELHFLQVIYFQIIEVTTSVLYLFTKVKNF